MAIAAYLPLCIALPIALCVSVILAEAQPHSKKLPRQKGSVQKESITDSILRRKIDSQLLQVLAQQQQRNTGIEPQFPIDVGADSNGNLPVDISAIITDSLLHTITALGGKIIYPSKVYRTVRAVVNLSVVKTIALRQDVSFIQPAGQAQNNGAIPRPGVN